MSRIALRCVVLFVVVLANRPVTAAEPELAKGIVVTTSGEPVAGINVVAFRGAKQLDETFVTDAKGQVFVPKEWRESQTWLTIIAKDGDQRLGWFDCMIHGHSNGGQTAEDGSFQLVLLPVSRRVRGRVLDQSGKPIANIPIQVLQLSHEENLTAVHWRYQTLDGVPLIGATRTNDEGHYELRLPVSTAAVLKASDPNWVTASIVVPKNKDVLPDTGLVPASTIQGRVVDARTGKPMVGIDVDAYAAKTKLFQSGGAEAKTDTEGRYVIRGLRAGEFTVVLRKATERILSAPAQVVALEPGVATTVDLKLQIAKRLVGRVVDMDTGLPIPNCSIRYTGPSYPMADVRLTTNDAGEFSLYALPGQSKLDASDGRRFGAESSKQIDVSATGKLQPVVLKVGEELEAVAGEIRMFVGPPLMRSVTLDFDRQPFHEVLEKVCGEAGLKADLDRSAFKASGYALNQQTTAKQAGKTTLENALKLLLKPYDNFTFSVDENRIVIRRGDP